MDTIQKINHPSFYRIMLGDFSTRLSVPPAFKNNFEKMDLRRDFTVSLKFVVEEGGVSWKVKVEKSRDGLYEFTGGWSKIVKDLNLAHTDFLVFYLVADYTFQLAVYDPSSRLKTLSINPPPTTYEGSSSGVGEQNAEESEEKNEKGRRIKRHTVKYTEPASKRSFCILPERFAQEVHKECNEEEEVLIEDDEGRRWVMKLKFRVQPTYRRYELTDGWPAFCVYNNVVVGDRFRFSHIQGSTIAVTVLRRE